LKLRSRLQRKLFCSVTGQWVLHFDTKSSVPLTAAKIATQKNRLSLLAGSSWGV